MGEPAIKLDDEKAKIEAETKAKAKTDAEYRGRAKQGFQTFQGKDFELPAFGASLLTAHFLFAATDTEKKSPKDWALRFRHQNPIVWAALHTGRVADLLMKMRVSGIETLEEDKLQEKAAIVRGQGVRLAD